jgi:hypothetical protein
MASQIGTKKPRSFMQPENFPSELTLYLAKISLKLLRQQSEQYSIANKKRVEQHPIPIINGLMHLDRWEQDFPNIMCLEGELWVTI